MLQTFALNVISGSAKGDAQSVAIVPWAQQRIISLVGLAMFTNAGDVKIESAYDAQTGLYMHNCFKSHADYPQWVKEQIALGREIRTITIAQLCDHMDETREQVQ